MTFGFHIWFMCHKTLFFLWFSSTVKKYLNSQDIKKKAEKEQVCPTYLPLLTSRTDPGNQCIRWSIRCFYIPVIQMTVRKPCFLCPLQEEFPKTPEKIIRVLNPISATTLQLRFWSTRAQRSQGICISNKNLKACVILILSRLGELSPL